MQDLWAAALLARRPGVLGAEALERLLRGAVGWGDEGAAPRALIQERTVLAPVHHQSGPLKPLETALVEDARVEALAMRRFPGLRRLWPPLHLALPSSPRTAPNLMARLARALFDGDCADPNGFIAEGRSRWRRRATWTVPRSRAIQF